MPVNFPAASLGPATPDDGTTERRGRIGRRRPSGRPTDNRLTWRMRLRRDRTLILMTLPAITLLIAFN
ncbi:hypothetical protein TN53_43285, partial [Streptomyces sp. WM6386]